jgi:hypothetical protein
MERTAATIVLLGGHHAGSQQRPESRVFADKMSLLPTCIESADCVAREEWKMFWMW